MKALFALHQNNQEFIFCSTLVVLVLLLLLIIIIMINIVVVVASAASDFAVNVVIIFYVLSNPDGIYDVKYSSRGKKAEEGEGIENEEGKGGGGPQKKGLNR